MSNLINAVARFAVTAEGRIYDYVKKVEVDAVDAYEAVDGWWNLHVVKRLVLAGHSIESAFTPKPVNVGVPVTPSATPADPSTLAHSPPVVEQPPTPPVDPSTPPATGLVHPDPAPAATAVAPPAAAAGTGTAVGLGELPHHLKVT